MLKLKHRLPAYSVLEHLCLDQSTIDGLSRCIQDLNNEFRSVLEINKELCGIHHELAKEAYDKFFQISLTDSHLENKDVTLADCETVHDNLHRGTRTDSIRRKKNISQSGSSTLDESTYTNKTEVYERYAELFDTIFAKFKGKPTRIRLVKLAAGSIITPHIDYDPSYAVRVIIPIIADQECVNIFWVKNNIESVAFVTGNAYFLNTGYKHAVVNMSKNDRYTLLVSVNGSEDIDHLIDRNLL